MIRRLRDAYVAIAVIVFNAMVLAVSINAGWALIHRWRHPLDPSLTGWGAALFDTYPDTLRRVYPNRDLTGIHALLVETWMRPMEYEPFTEFRERPFRGAYVNVSREGFRNNGHSQAWPASANAVFLFGGSTTFGYGLADDETIAAAFERELQSSERRAVYNFGRGSYYSGQEQVLFERLIAQGHRPAIAIFIDGYNDFTRTADEPGSSPTTRAQFNAPPLRWSDYLSTLAAVTGVRAIIGRFTPQPPPAHSSAEDFDGVIDHYLAHVSLIRAVAAGFGVQPIFVWQPVPGDSQPLSQHPFYRNDDGTFGTARLGYRHARERRMEFDRAGIRWCADLVSPAGETMWVDPVHYSAAFSRRLVRDCLVPALSARPESPSSRTGH